MASFLPPVRRVLLAVAPGLLPSSIAVAQAAPAIRHTDYTDSAAWLCRPGRADPCAGELASTVIQVDGARSLEHFAPDPAAPIDCFYVYPTVSRQQTPDSDLSQTDAERGAARLQFAPFASVCRPFAPMYRQTTLAEVMRRNAAGQPFSLSPTAYNDVRDAWMYYLTHDNHGRGVVLIGHSQGSAMLTALIAREIDGRPAQERIVSAVLAGIAVGVPPGRDVGGTFSSMPLCHSSTQTGCIITWSSFRAESPPPPKARFGVAREPGLVAACTNPAALSGGEAIVHSLFNTRGLPLVDIELGTPIPFAWASAGGEVTTPYASLPGLLTAECASNENASGYLAVTRHATPGAVRTNDIPGDLVAGGKVQAEWGLHAVDINLVFRDLLDVVREQAKAYVGRGR